MGEESYGQDEERRTAGGSTRRKPNISARNKASVTEMEVLYEGLDPADG